MKTIKYFFCILLLIFTSRIYSQVPDTIWTKTFGGTLSDVGVSVKQTKDDGFIIAATTSSFGAGGQDIYLIKTDENGDTLWTKTFGGTGNDRAANVVQTNDNGYAVFGTTNSFGNGGDDFLLWKADSLGNTEWYKMYGGSFNDICTEGKQTSDGGFITTGYFYNQVVRSTVIKIDGFGNERWNKTLKVSNYSDLWSYSVEQAFNDNYFIGCTWGHDYFGGYAYEWYMYQLSSDGDSLFSTYYFNVGADFLTKIRTTIDGNLILGGSTAYEYIWLKKRNPYGGTIWSRIISVSSADVFLTDIESTSDNGYIISAIVYVSSNNSLRDIVLLKTDSDGFLQWETRILGSGVEDALSVCTTDEAEYIVAGKTNSLGTGDFDVWLLKFKNNPASEIQVSKDSLHLTFDTTSFTSEDSLIIYNTGSATLNVDTIYSTNASGFLLDVILNDTTIHTSVTSRGNYYNPFEIEPNDSAKLIFTYPLWVPKEFNISETWIDTIIILNNSINNSSLAIHTLIDYPVGVGNEIDNLPATFSLSQNYPNPFNPSTKIKFEIPDQVRNDNRFVTLKVYDVLGNEIATLVNEEKQPGTYEVEFNTSSIKHLPSTGIYFYQIKAGNYTETKKMILLK